MDYSTILVKREGYSTIPSPLRVRGWAVKVIFEAVQRLLVSSSICIHCGRPRPTPPKDGCGCMTEAASARTPVLSPNVTKPHSQSRERRAGLGPIFCFLPGSKDDDDGGGDKIAEAKRGKERGAAIPLCISGSPRISGSPTNTLFQLGSISGCCGGVRPQQGLRLGGIWSPHDDPCKFFPMCYLDRF